MVRLGGGWRNRNIACDHVSIPVWFDWERNPDTVTVNGEEVSIPVWFDWETFDNQAAAEKSVVSIPVWFDWETKKKRLRIGRDSVSIPVWFDWEDDLLNHDPRLLCFNSSMVRLGAV